MVPQNSAFSHDWSGIQCIGIPLAVQVYLLATLVPSIEFPPENACSSMVNIYNGRIDIHDWFMHITAMNDVRHEVYKPPTMECDPLSLSPVRLQYSPVSVAFCVSKFYA